MPSFKTAKALASPEFLFREQFDYGHREILLRYAGLPSDYVLRGRIQHGWDPFDSEPIRRYRPEFYREGVQFVWTKEAAERGRGAGLRKVFPIGAPWLYLLKTLSGHLPNSQPGRVLAIPGHFNEAATRDYHESFIQATLLAFPDATSVSVLLHGLDFMRREIRMLYERAAIPIESAGWPAGVCPPRLPSSAVGDRTEFLPNLFEMMAFADVVATDSIGSHVLYASSMGKPLRLLPIRRDLISLSSSNIAPAAMMQSIHQEFRWLDRHFGEYVGGVIDESFLRRLSDRLLGASSVLSSQQLSRSLTRT